MAPTPVRQARFRRPAGACELLLVRHGESEPAHKGRPFPLVDGHGDPALSPAGESQAERVAARLVDEAIDAVYVTTLRRTAQTARPLLDRTGLAATVEADLREVHLGDWEGGRFRLKVAAGDPIAVQVWEEQRWDAIPGAESADRLRARVTAAVGRIAAAHPDQRVAVFTHGGIIGEILAVASGARALAFVGCDNGSISHVVVHGDRWSVRRVNDTGHLPGGLDRPEAGPGSPTGGFSA